MFELYDLNFLEMAKLCIYKDWGKKLSGIEVPIMRIPIHGPDVPNDIILKKLRDLSPNDARIIHFDIASSVCVNNL